MDHPRVGLASNLRISVWQLDAWLFRQPQAITVLLIIPAKLCNLVQMVHKQRRAV